MPAHAMHMAHGSCVPCSTIDMVPAVPDTQPGRLLKLLWLALLQVEIEGLPTTDNWPAAAEVKKLLSARIGRPFTTQEIEDDVRTLLATGGCRRAAPLGWAVACLLAEVHWSGM